MKEYIIGDPCPECGGCNYYCADCVDPEIEALRAVADAAQAVQAAWLGTCPVCELTFGHLPECKVGKMVSALVELKKARGG